MHNKTFKPLPQDDIVKLHGKGAMWHPGKSCKWQAALGPKQFQPNMELSKSLPDVFTGKADNYLLPYMV